MVKKTKDGSDYDEGEWPLWTTGRVTWGHNNVAIRRHRRPESDRKQAPQPFSTLGADVPFAVER